MRARRLGEVTLLSFGGAESSRPDSMCTAGKVAIVWDFFDERLIRNHRVTGVMPTRSALTCQSLAVMSVS